MKHPLSSIPTPSPEEIDAAIRRAHHERAVAFRRILGALFGRKDAAAEAVPVHGVTAATCR
jgi:hypothetical protein